MFETGEKEASTKLQIRTPMKTLFTDNTQIQQGYTQIGVFVPE